MIIFNMDRRLWEEADGLFAVEFTISNGKFAAVQEAYFYPEKILEFGRRLQEFPVDISDTVSLECGSSDPKWSCHLYVCAFVLNKAGHTAVEILTDNRRERPDSARSHFFIRCDPLTLNRLGRHLCRWVDAREDALEFVDEEER